MSDKCMRCPYTRVRPAKETRFFSIGERPDHILKLRLCETCVGRFDREVGQWVRLAGLIELATPAPRVPRAAGGSAFSGDNSAKRLRELREKAAKRGKPVTGSAEEEVDEVLLIGPHADEWRFTVHAQERASERGFTNAQVLKSAAYPETKIPSASNPGTYYFITDDCCVVVDPKTKLIITVYDRFQAFLKSSDEKASQEKGIA